jgi:dipeptidyl-peptidase-3
VLVPLIVLAGALAAEQSPLVEQVDDFGFYQVESPSFAKLSPRQKRLAYWLSRAAILIDPIIYDQLSFDGLREKKLVTALIEDPNRLPAESRDAIVKYAKLFLANRGNHNATSNRKFIPTVSSEAFSAAAQAAREAGARLGTKETLDRLLGQLRQPLFDPGFEPVLTQKTPPPGKDIITGSSTTFYGPGVTLADVKDYKDTHPLNSRIEKMSDGSLVEDPYRAGKPGAGIPAGMYATELGRSVEALRNARKDADPQQQKVIDDLIEYDLTGAPTDWHTFNVDWVQNDASVDFVLGFVETYRDARAAKGAAESLVCVKDSQLSPLMQKLAANALYFEQRAPWEDRFRKLDVKAPIGKAVEALIETADFRVNTVGDNLPNEEDIHRAYGTKNFLITNAAKAFSRTRGTRVVQEFQPDALPRYAKYGALAENLVTAMHEIIGHGSGKSVTTEEPRQTLREYYSTLEEARADLVAYWNATDPKLSALGVAHQAEVSGAMYDQLARTIFSVVNHYPKGDQTEEDHDRARLMIWNWVRERGGIGLVEKNGKHEAAVLNADKAHEAVGELLAKLMLLKGTGDHDGIKTLVDSYGLHFDPALRDEVVARFKSLGLPRYAAGIYADLTLSGRSGKEDVKISYPRDFLKQQVELARINGTLGFSEGELK